MAKEHALLVGTRIREAREDKGWTQRELAEKIPGKTDGTQVSKWERGVNRVSDDTLTHIATALEKPYSWFHASPTDKSTTPDPFESSLAPNNVAIQQLAGRLDAIEAKLDELLDYRKEAEKRVQNFNAEEAIEYLTTLQEWARQAARDVGLRGPQRGSSADRPPKAA